jgi:hypothetical protein
MRHTQLPMDLLWAAVWTIRDGKAVCGQGYMTKAEAIAAIRRPRGPRRAAGRTPR